MASDIKLTNTEVLGYSQSSNFVGGAALYQFGRTISLDITAFIHPTFASGNFPNEGQKFEKADQLQEEHIKELLATGFVDRIEIGTEVINNVKIISYTFPTSQGALDNKINLLRVNMSLEYYEVFDNRSALKSADGEIYDNTNFLDNQYTKHFDSFSENFSFSVSDAYEFSYTHNVSLSLKPSSSSSVDLVQKAKDIVNLAFLEKAPKLGNLDSRYKDFIRDVSERGEFSESYDSINNSYSFSKQLSLKSGAHKTSQKNKKWSSTLTYDISSDEVGAITITETGAIQGRLGTNETSEYLYKNSYDGLEELTGTVSVARARCQTLLEKFVKDKPTWLQGEEEWSTSDDLTERFVSFGKSIDRTAGVINYTLVFTTNPRMHNDAIFEYTIEASKDEMNVTQVTENGNITPYHTNKNQLFSENSGSLAKQTYDKLVTTSKVLNRIKPLYESVRDESRSGFNLTSPKNLISKNISFNGYGIQITYSFVFSDNKNLRDSTYIRTLDKTDSYKMPVINRQSFIAPNNKTTNADANQSSLGSKDISISCSMKRNPATNIINNQAHANYLKTAADSIFSSLNEETEKSAFIRADQSKGSNYNFFLNQLTYNFDQSYNFSYDASLSFVDKRGVSPERLKY